MGTAGGSGLVPGYAPSKKGTVFCSAHRRALWAKRLIAAALLCCMLGIGSSILQLDLMLRIGAGVQITEREANANDLRERVIAAATWLVFIASASAFLMWIYQASRNLRALGRHELRFTPAGSVGWWFAPVLNLWKPYQLMRELVEESRQAAAGGGMFAGGHSGARVAWWWAAWIIGSLTSRIGSHLAVPGQSLSAFLTATWANIAGSLLLIAAGLLLMRIINDIDRWQSQAAAIHAPVETVGV